MALQNQSASFTRPANTTAYASGQLIANSVTAATVVPLKIPVAGGAGAVRRARIAKSGTTPTNAIFRLHLYSTNPSVTSGIVNGDGGAWVTNKVGYLGSLTLAAAMPFVFTDGCVGIAAPDTGSELNVNVAGLSFVYGLLEARAVYTPATAEVFTVSLEIQ